MAHSPRKPGSGRKTTPDPAIEDLFSTPPNPLPSPAEPAPTDEWTLEDGPAPSSSPSLIPPRQKRAETIPPLAPGSIKVAPILTPEAANFESNSRSAAGAIPEAVLPPAPGQTRSAPPPGRAPEMPDPFEIDDDLPAVAPKPVPGPAEVAFPAPGEDSGAAISEVDPGEPEPAAFPSPAPRPRANRAGLLAAGALLLGLLGLFFGLLFINRPEAPPRASRPEPTLPLQGQVATLSSIDSGWRTRQPGDQVSTVDVTLPVPSRQQPALLPMVRITTTATSATGFLRFIFLDAEGKISGDVRVIKVSAGTIDPLSSGAKVSPPGTATIFGSLGFMDRPGFVAYATGASPRWSVQVSESTLYNAKDEAWTKLDTFDLRDASDP